MNSYITAEKTVRIAEVLHERFSNLTVKETNELALKVIKAVDEVDQRMNEASDDIPF